MTVSELAKRAGIGPQTVRFYEKRGLLAKPSRWGDGAYRDFDDDALTSLRFIQGAKAAGFTLAEIKQLLELRLPPRGSCAEVEAIFAQKVTALDRQIANLRRMRATLETMRNACKGRKRRETCLALWTLEDS
jgi:DNA-binding transcriptional MerR regulator